LPFFLSESTIAITNKITEANKVIIVEIGVITPIVKRIKPRIIRPITIYSPYEKCILD
jgi:hypothetical protein